MKLRATFRPAIRRHAAPRRALRLRGILAEAEAESEALRVSVAAVAVVFIEAAEVVETAGPRVVAAIAAVEVTEEALADPAVGAVKEPVAST